eukprot:8686134-Pyramimonas_sp.AAC.1
MHSKEHDVRGHMDANRKNAKARNNRSMEDGKGREEQEKQYAGRKEEHEEGGRNRGGGTTDDRMGDRPDGQTHWGSEGGSRGARPPN